MKLISSILILFSLICIINAKSRYIVADHNVIKNFDIVPDSLLSKAIPLRLMLRHASIGAQIDLGLDCIQGTRTNPKECTLFPQYKYDRRNWDLQPRDNSGWYGKVDDFITQVQEQLDSFDVFSFKFCYLDGIDGLDHCSKPNDIIKPWNYLKDKMEWLEAKFPAKKIIWWTIPLTQSGQQCTDSLNKRIRQYAKENGKYLFDIADIESYDTTGTHLTSLSGWEMAFCGYCGEKPPGPSCHPNWPGSIILGKAIWWMMANIANDIPITNVSQERNSESVYLVPNPASDQISIYNYEGNAEIFNVMGLSMWKGNISSDLRIDVSNFGNSIYFLKTEFGNSTNTKKFVIIR